MLVNSETDISMVKVSTPQKMAKYSKGYGRTEKEMEKVD
jgi:hypothetical protein